MKSDDTPTPADVAEAADELQSWLDGDQTGIDEDAVQVAVNVMRSAPPAPGNGAAEMREACFEVADEVATMCAEDPSVVGLDADPKQLGAALTEIVDRCVANHSALPAPEVPEAGRVPDIARLWCEQFDGRSSNTLYDRLLRNMLREWYNV